MNLVHQDLDIVDLYRKIRINPQYLDVPNEMTFVESPLHTAASEGRTGLALEILRLKPSLGKKLNFDGLSPLHLALGNGHTNTVRRLVKHDPDLIRVQGREGFTLLHYAVAREEIDLLIYFLLSCPLSIFDLTVRDETAMHIAVRNNSLGAFKVLFGWAKKANKTSVMRWRNEEGNTLMHLAALTNQLEVMRSLIGCVGVNKKNLEGMTALDILQPENIEARRILRRARARAGLLLVDDATSCENYLTSKMTITDKLFQFGAYLEYGLSGEMRNVILIVVVLIATATFQATLTPPAFVISHNDTTPVFPNITSVYNDTTSTNATRFNLKGAAKLCAIYNSCAFSIAMGTCAILTLDPLYPFQYLLWLSLILFSVSYAGLTFGIYPGTVGVIIFVIVMSLSVLPVYIIYPWKTIRSNWLRSGDYYYKYSLYKVKYLVFGSRFMNQGPVLTSMAERKAPR